MKRTAFAAILCGILACTALSAQVYDAPRFGIIAGASSTSSSFKALDAKSVFQYHAGAVLEIPLGLGFALQPGLEYQAKAVRLDQVKDSTIGDIAGSFETKAGFVEASLQMQWGPKLGFLRPYVFAEPFAGYRITGSTKAEGSGADWSSFTAGLKKVEYGLGLGAGLDVWRLQLSAKYFWNFGQLSEEGSGEKAVERMKTLFTEGSSNFNGIIFSLAFLF